jgi:hypothetical protein
MFEKFPSLTRFSQDWTITEKIDGSNTQIFISIDPIADATPLYSCDGEFGTYVYAGSRSRFLEPTKQGDHMGFARWVQDNVEKLVETLGHGRHYGEWWGRGIQRGYDLNERRFSLFNVSRWNEEDVCHIPGLHVVPVIGAQGDYLGEPGKTFDEAMRVLKTLGSQAASGYMNPEGIVMFHGRSGTLFKKTFDYDELGKWAEKHEKGEHANAA